MAHLVSRTNVLAVTLTDFGVPVEARRAVLDELLRARVHPVALRLVLRAVEAERADAFPTVLHELYELARHMHDLRPQELAAEEPIRGRTEWRHYAAGYAAAIFEGISDTAGLEEVEDELFRFARIVESNSALARALADATVPSEQRAGLVHDLLDGKVTPATARLALVVVQGHVRDLPVALDWLVEQAAQARGWRVARVRAAMPVDADEQQQMTDALEHLTHGPVELQITLDAALLGGAVVQIGDLLVDASALHRLEQLEEHLLRPDTTMRGARA
ncbi:MAG: ATP synthase F1 subunit delta [Acidimicrobiales bacterium]